MKLLDEYKKGNGLASCIKTVKLLKESTSIVVESCWDCDIVTILFWEDKKKKLVHTFLGENAVQVQQIGSYHENSDQNKFSAQTLKVETYDFGFLSNKWEWKQDILTSVWQSMWRI